MITPEIRDYSCTDIENIDTWVPAEATDVDFWLTLMIGIDQHGGDNFDLHVVTPKNLAPGPDAKKYAVVLNEYSRETLRNEIQRILQECTGFNWSDICEQLSKRFHWEYEGMVPPYVR
jgi:hypothetical protein